ncbi:hypothetical protein AWB94_29425 [Mycolicibacterium canariasense]|nr:hypothetical protein AWB94_29425 [Mycolicibacterium canariasense]
MVTHDGDLASGRGSLRWPGATFVTVEWFDRYSAVFDAGFDAINTVGLVINCRDTYVAVDLLMESQPTPDAMPMTSPGDREHPDDIGKGGA